VCHFKIKFLNLINLFSKGLQFATKTRNFFPQDEMPSNLFIYGSSFGSTTSISIQQTDAFFKYKTYQHAELRAIVNLLCERESF